MRLVLQLPPNMLNSRMHWGEKHRKRRAYLLRAHVDLQNQRDEWRGVELPKPARFTVTLFVHQLMDKDNATARLKFVWDSVVHAGILPDDTLEYLDPTVEQAVDRKNPRVELEL